MERIKEGQIYRKTSKIYRIEKVEGEDVWVKAIKDIWGIPKDLNEEAVKYRIQMAPEGTHEVVSINMFTALHANEAQKKTPIAR